MDVENENSRPNIIQRREKMNNFVEDNNKIFFILLCGCKRVMLHQNFKRLLRKCQTTFREYFFRIVYGMLATECTTLTVKSLMAKQEEEGIVVSCEIIY